MGNRAQQVGLVFGLGLVGVAAVGCDPPPADPGVEASWAALMDDGDLARVAPDAMGPPSPFPPPPFPPPSRFCPGDCASSPLAFWRMDDCNPFSTQLSDSAFTGFTQHPAFRAVSVACVAGAAAQGVQLSREDDIVYAPDQPDFVFDQGLTIAAWIKPDRITGTQSIVRKRLEGSSSFLLAIDGRRLNFVLRLTSGRVVGVTAPIPAGRFTHVAATYDGQQAILYVDGVAAARARAVGTIGPGVGPILIGNDANGREMKGIVDEVWLNTLAAPAATIAGLTCLHRPPVVALSPAETPPQIAGATVAFDLAVTNTNSASCGASMFQFFAPLPFPLATDTFSGVVAAGPGETAHVPLGVRSLRSSQAGSYPFQVFVLDGGDFQNQVQASATYVVGTGPVACDGSPPFTPQIIGSFASPAGGPPYTFAAPGVAFPVVTPVTGPDGSTQALQVTVDAQAPSDPASAYLGFGLGFGQPPCVDASAFVGVRFTITGDLGTCAPTFSVVVSQDNSVAFGPFGTCTADVCLSPSAGGVTTGTNVVRFADMAGGTPLATVDPTALNGVQWTLTAPCTGSFTISDVAFVSDTASSAISYTFDRDTQGWAFSDFTGGPPLINLAVAVPPGSPGAPTLSFEGADGDPSSGRGGSLRMTAPFTALDQYVDAIASFPFPGRNSSGRTLHAMVKLVSGSFTGGIQLHASSGPAFTYAGAFVDASSFVPGVWVPVTLDLGAQMMMMSPPGFDASQIVQVGVALFSGFSSGGGAFVDDGPVVLEIDTVTD